MFISYLFDSLLFKCIKNLKYWFLNINNLVNKMGKEILN